MPHNYPQMLAGQSGIIPHQQQMLMMTAAGHPLIYRGHQQPQQPQYGQGMVQQQPVFNTPVSLVFLVRKPAHFLASQYGTAHAGASALHAAANGRLFEPGR